MAHLDLYLSWTLRLLLCATILSDLELLSLRRLFLLKGFLDCGMITTRFFDGRGWRLERWSVLKVLVGGRIAASVFALLSVHHSGLERVLLSSILLVSLVMRRVRRTGNNASDDMMFIAQIVSTVAVFEDAVGVAIAFVFLSTQLSLSYITAGVAKGFQPEWRTGVSVNKILSSSTFCHKALYAGLGQDLRLHRLIGHCTIAGELFLSAAPWVPPRICLFLLVAAFTFHLGVAAIMGLNTFLPTFLSLYPAAFFTSRLLHSGGY